ncbi:MAG: STAS/SEC14 domain-containing protein [Okeania sp. SIO2D1]|uniref:STAS/SEC14 domain-containing protein n=1 Tax=Okeania sp. SIO2C9 TaxID=2607791 RepID=UPI0013BC7A03|nr:STAS/SEC14 domain-containing protein [Okeania sp. SIO2C9]NEQ78265.1 STAS/SEC14 domain-containing protein [Okeania sp. SIO2C9]NES71561.1 STAS/SEC14 domain-containing protein [Okeania sp. SIO2D1]
MMEIIPLANQNIIGLSIDGKIEISDIEKVKNLVEERLKSQPKLRVYVEVKSFQGISMEALWEDLKFGLGHMKYFDKKAVVCDAAWVNKLTTASNKIFSNMTHIEVKCFSWSEKEQGLEWIIIDTPRTKIA